MASAMEKLPVLPQRVRGAEMSDTPQTDHEEFFSGGPGGYGLMMVVSAAFAQKLERERDEARKALLWTWDKAEAREEDPSGNTLAAVAAARAAVEGEE